jgi:hypothetical protein
MSLASLVGLKEKGWNKMLKPIKRPKQLAQQNSKAILLFFLSLMSVSVLFQNCSNHSFVPIDGLFAKVTVSPDIQTGMPGAAGTANNDYNGVSYESGATVPFKIVSSAVFNKWVATHPVDPTDVYLNVNVQEVSNHNGAHVGEVKIHYRHNSTTEYEATLTSHTETYNDADYFMYNKFATIDGKSVFTGFFDDKIGGIVLVIDKSNDQGDGGGASEVGGSIWFKNFQKSFASYDEGASWSIVLPCWFRTLGPYDCHSDTIINKSSTTPSNGYELLGTFNNMNRLKAFNLN